MNGNIPNNPAGGPQQVTPPPGRNVPVPSGAGAAYVNGTYAEQTARIMVRGANRAAMAMVRGATAAFRPVGKGVGSAVASGGKAFHAAVAGGSKAFGSAVSGASKSFTAAVTSGSKAFSSAVASGGKSFSSLAGSAGKSLANVTRYGGQGFANATKYGGQAFASLSKSAGKMLEGAGRRAGKSLSDAKRPDYGQKLGQVGSAANQAGGGMKGIGKTLLAGAAGVMGALFLPLRRAAQMQQYEASIATQVGGKENAKSVMADLREFNKRTPMELPEIVGNASQILMGRIANKDNLTGQLQKVGDAAGGDPEKMERIVRALSQMRMKGKVTQEELTGQLGELIPAMEILSSKMGIAKDVLFKEISRGAVKADVAVQALIDGMGDLYGGRMAAQSRTFFGRWSTLKDSLWEAATPIGEALLPMVSRLMESMFKLVERVGEFLKSSKDIAFQAGAVAAGLALAGAAAVATGLGFSALGVVFGGVSAAVTILAGVAGFLVTPLGAGLAVVTALTAGFLAWGVATGQAGVWLKWLGDQLGPLLDGFKRLGAGIRDALVSGDVMGAVRVLWAGLKLAFAVGKLEVLKIWDGLWTSAVAAVLSARLSIMRAWGPLVDGIIGAWEGLTDSLTRMMLSWRLTALAVASDIAAAFWAAAAAVAESLGNGKAQAFSLNVATEKQNATTFRGMRDRLDSGAETEVIEAAVDEGGDVKRATAEVERRKQERVDAENARFNSRAESERELTAQRDAMKAGAGSGRADLKAEIDAASAEFDAAVKAAAESRAKAEAETADENLPPGLSSIGGGRDGKDGKGGDSDNRATEVHTSEGQEAIARALMGENGADKVVGAVRQQTRDLLNGMRQSGQTNTDRQEPPPGVGVNPAGGNSPEKPKSVKERQHEKHVAWRKAKDEQDAARKNASREARDKERPADFATAAKRERNAGLEPAVSVPFADAAKTAEKGKAENLEIVKGNVDYRMGQRAESDAKDQSAAEARQAEAVRLRNAHDGERKFSFDTHRERELSLRERGRKWLFGEKNPIAEADVQWPAVPQPVAAEGDSPPVAAMPDESDRLDQLLKSLLETTSTASAQASGLLSPNSPLPVEVTSNGGDPTRINAELLQETRRLRRAAEDGAVTFVKVG